METSHIAPITPDDVQVHDVASTMDPGHVDPVFDHAVDHPADHHGVDPHGLDPHF